MEEVGTGGGGSPLDVGNTERGEHFLYILGAVNGQASIGLSMVLLACILVEVIIVVNLGAKSRSKWGGWKPIPWISSMVTQRVDLSRGSTQW